LDFRFCCTQKMEKGQSNASKTFSEEGSDPKFFLKKGCSDTKKPKKR
jgi:hypothetical protein